MATTQTEVYRVTGTASSTLSTKLLQYRLQRLSTCGRDRHINESRENSERSRAREYLKVCKNMISTVCYRSSQTRI